MAGWNGLDWVLAAIVFISIAAAAIKGFVREIIAIASVVAGVTVAALGYRQLAPGLQDLTRSEAVALGVSFLLLFLAVIAVGAVVSALTRKLIQKADLTGFDRMLGALFGLVRAVLIDTVLLLALLAFSIKPELVQQSRLAPYVATGARLMALAMPQELRTNFTDGFEKFRQMMIENDKKALDKKPAAP
jgi:membrane protein required for colicin V production